jgi:hypothetical protein
LELNESPKKMSRLSSREKVIFALFVAATVMVIVAAEQQAKQHTDHMHFQRQTVDVDVTVIESRPLRLPIATRSKKSVFGCIISRIKISVKKLLLRI